MHQLLILIYFTDTFNEKSVQEGNEKTSNKNGEIELSGWTKLWTKISWRRTLWKKTFEKDNKKVSMYKILWQDITLERI